MTDQERPATQIETLVAEPMGDGIGVMTACGDVKRFADSDAVVRWARRRNAIAARRSNAIIVTRIEWRSMPDDFVPPEIRS